MKNARGDVAMKEKCGNINDTSFEGTGNKGMRGRGFSDCDDGVDFVADDGVVSSAMEDPQTNAMRASATIVEMPTKATEHVWVVQGLWVDK